MVSTACRQYRKAVTAKGGQLREIYGLFLRIGRIKDEKNKRIKE